MMHSPGSVAFSIFGLDVMWYGLLIGGGFLLATVISYLRAPKHNIKPDFILDLVIWMVPSAMIGARAYYVIFSWSDYAGDWRKILDIRSGGLAVHGGLILCFLVGYFVCRHYKQGFVRAIFSMKRRTVRRRIFRGRRSSTASATTRPSCMNRSGASACSGSCSGSTTTSAVLTAK